MKTHLINRWLFLFCLMSSSLGHAQNSSFSIGFFYHSALSGHIRLESLYREQKTLLKTNASELQKSSVFSGELSLKSSSYLWLPNFFNFDIDLNYNPGTRKDNFLVIPDRSEARTVEQLKFRATFFRQLPLMLSFSTNFSHNYINREYLTNLEVFQKDIGGILSYRNSFLPVFVSVKKSSWKQNEFPTGRILKYNSLNAQTRLSKSFSKWDENDFNFSYEEYLRDYLQSRKIHNTINNLQFKNRLFFDHKKENTLHSMITAYKIIGKENYTRLQLYENLNLKLPASLKLNSNYQYYNLDRSSVPSNQYSLRTRLEHTLYLSLKTQLYQEYFNYRQPEFSEIWNAGGISFRYQKKIPAGLLSFRYEHRERNQEKQSDAYLLRIVFEEHTLSDDQITLLDNLFILKSSILVSDATRSIIYRENIDYVLIERGDYIEIQRLPGGQIGDAETVYIDYQATRNDSYKFRTNNNNYSINLTLFEHFIELYYRSFRQHYSNTHGPDYLVLNPLEQKVFGCRLSYGYVSAGIEYDNFEQNIVPYNATRYFVNINGSLSNSLLISLIGNRRDNYLIKDRDEQQVTDISGRLVWNVWYGATLNLEGGYREHIGRKTNLHLYNLRTEFNTKYRQVILTAGIELYHRMFFTEESTYNGVFARISRQF